KELRRLALVPPRASGGGQGVKKDLQRQKRAGPCVRRERARNQKSQQGEGNEPAEKFVRNVLEKKGGMPPGRPKPAENEEAVQLQHDDADFAAQLRLQIQRGAFNQTRLGIEPVLVALLV